MLAATVKPPILSTNFRTELASETLYSTGVVYENLFDHQTGGYSHSSSATVGYDSMSTDIIVSEAETRDWITYGLGRHIEVYAPSGRVWEGFVNKISVSIGATTIEIGPLLDLANKVKVAYTTRRWNTNPPIGGDPAETAFATDSESVARWGTFEEVISGGEGVAVTMEALRDSKLNELAWPKIGQDFSTGTKGQGSISLSCLGYYHYLSRFLFDTNTGVSSTVNVSQRVADILDADPDSLFRSTNASIETNTLQVPDYDDGREALTALQEAVGLGFGSGQRALFRVGNDRLVTYESLALDKDSKYVYSMYDRYPDLSLPDGTSVPPWDILTGEWIRIQSLTSRPLSPSLPRHSNPQYIFIESVTYDAPNSIRIQGGLGNTLKGKMARAYSLAMDSYG